MIQQLRPLPVIECFHDQTKNPSTDGLLETFSTKATVDKNDVIATAPPHTSDSRPSLADISVVETCGPWTGFHTRIRSLLSLR